MLSKRVVVPFLAGVLISFAVSASAQVQPWKAPNGAVESRVQACTVPTPLNQIAMDDFLYTVNTKVTWLRWWGVVSDPAQLHRRYHIAVWSNLNAGPCPPVAGIGCHPDVRLQVWCVDVSTTIAGTDCNGRVVYRFTAGLTPPFLAVANTKYWLQISEIDDESINVGVEDFRWSGYRPVTNCPAQQRNAAGGVNCATPDDCVPPVGTDLSFVLRRKCLGGVIAVPPQVQLPHIFLAEIRPPGPLNVPPLTVEVVEPDQDGQFAIDPELPDGNYMITLVGMGAARPTRTFTMLNDVGVVSFFDVFVGDLTNNGHVQGDDIPLMLNGLLNAP